MKTLEQTKNTILQTPATPIIMNSGEHNIHLLAFHGRQHQQILRLKVKNIEHDNYRLFLNNSRLMLILSETKEISRPSHVSHMRWDARSYSHYEVMRNVEIWLPGDDFFLVRHYVIPRQEILHIVLGKVQMN